MSKEQEQSYHGNGQHTWEEVCEISNGKLGSLTTRLRVPGGWLYSVALSTADGVLATTVFVPMPEVVKHAV